MADCDEITIQNNSSSSTIRAGVIPASLSISSIDDDESKCESNENTSSVMNKHKSFDPSSLSKKGIFHGRTTYSKIEQPTSTRSLDYQSLHSLHKSLNADKVLSKKPQTPLSYRATTTTSLFKCDIHKQGKIPLYLNKTNKYTMESELISKKSKLTNMKRKLIQDQTDVLQLHKQITEIQHKVNKLSGKQTPIEKIELIAYSRQTNLKQFLIECNEEISLKEFIERQFSEMCQTIKELFKTTKFGFFTKIQTPKSNKTKGKGLDNGEPLKTLEENILNLMHKQQEIYLDSLYDTCSKNGSSSTSSSTNETCLKIELAEKLKILDKQINERKQLQQDIETKNQELYHVKCENEIFSNELQTVQKDLKEINSRVKEKNQEILKIKNESKKTMEEFNFLKAQLKESISLETENKKTIEDLNTENVKSKKLISNFNELNKTKTNEYNRLRNDLVECRKQLELQKKHGEKIHNNFDQAIEIKHVDYEQKIINCRKNSKIVQCDPDINQKLMDEQNDILLKLQKDNECLEQKTKLINKLEDNLKSQNSEIVELKRNTEKEISMLLLSRADQLNELTCLREKLNKANDEIKRDKEKLFSYENILKVRAELIETLQKNIQQNNKTHHISYEPKEKSQSVKPIENEIDDVDSNYFSLSTNNKQMLRQGKIIEIIKANNEKCRQIRASQITKIAELQLANEQLRENCAANGDIVDKPFPETDVNVVNDVNNDDANDTNDNFNQAMFNQMRKKKRNEIGQIMVKKYTS